jgi:hypothetical protein
MTTPNVQYAYASGSANHIRPTLQTYPSGRELNYGSADSTPDAASRRSSTTTARPRLADRTNLSLEEAAAGQS